MGWDEEGVAGEHYEEEERGVLSVGKSTKMMGRQNSNKELLRGLWTELLEHRVHFTDLRSQNSMDSCRDHVDPGGIENSNEVVKRSKAGKNRETRERSLFKQPLNAMKVKRVVVASKSVGNRNGEAGKERKPPSPMTPAKIRQARYSMNVNRSMDTTYSMHNESSAEASVVSSAGSLSEASTLSIGSSSSIINSSLLSSGTGRESIGSAGESTRWSSGSFGSIDAEMTDINSGCHSLKSGGLNHKVTVALQHKIATLQTEVLELQMQNASLQEKLTKDWSETRANETEESALTHHNSCNEVSARKTIGYNDQQLRQLETQCEVLRDQDASLNQVHVDLLHSMFLPLEPSRSLADVIIKYTSEDGSDMVRKCDVQMIRKYIQYLENSLENKKESDQDNIADKENSYANNQNSKKENDCKNPKIMREEYELKIESLEQQLQIELTRNKHLQDTVSELENNCERLDRKRMQEDAEKESYRASWRQPRQRPAS
eukprot:757457-Hanusia_phi.AAC.1